MEETSQSCSDQIVKNIGRWEKSQMVQHKMHSVEDYPEKHQTEYKSIWHTCTANCQENTIIGVHGVRTQQCTYTIKKLSKSLTPDKQQLEAIFNSD